jgi:hypothetical protein
MNRNGAGPDFEMILLQRVSYAMSMTNAAAHARSTSMRHARRRSPSLEFFPEPRVAGINRGRDALLRVDATLRCAQDWRTRVVASSEINHKFGGLTGRNQNGRTPRKCPPLQCNALPLASFAVPAFQGCVDGVRHEGRLSPLGNARGFSLTAPRATDLPDT